MGEYRFIRGKKLTFSLFYGIMSKSSLNLSFLVGVLFLCVLSSIFLSKSFFSRVSIDLLNLWIDPLCAQSCDREPLNELRIDPPRSIPLAPTLRNFREKFPAQFFPLRALERNLDRSTKIDTTYLLVKKILVLPLVL